VPNAETLRHGNELAANRQRESKEESVMPKVKQIPGSGMNPLRRALQRMSPLQKEIAAAVLMEDDELVDESLAERYGMTAGAIRIERRLAARQIHDAIYSR
jgi:hypothetical protein